MDYIKLAQRTIAMFSSMIESGECHTTRSKEMKDNALNGLEQLRIGAVSNSEVFEHYGKPFTSGRDLWDFLTAHYNFTPKT